MSIFSRNQKKIKINVIGENFWMQPTIWTWSRRKYAARPYKSLLKLLKNESLLSDNFVFTFNSDENLELFRVAQQIKEIPFFLNGLQQEEIFENGHVDFAIPKTRITIRFDKKSLTALKRGYTPFLSKQWLRENFRSSGQILLKWTNSGYVEL